MGRRAGVRNQDYEATREALARKALGAVVAHGAQASLHDLARAAEVSIPTLKHYFGERSGAVAEALRTVKKDAAQYIATMADPGELGLEASFAKLARDLAMVWVPAGVGKVFQAGMAAGLFDEAAGPGYLDGVLEPAVLATEERLRVHARRGEADLDPEDDLAVRTAALAFLSPLLVALFHQHGLSGTRCRPLAMDAFIATYVARFAKAYGRAGAPEKRARR
jgi:AcrR family transcriptional regulator